MNMLNSLLGWVDERFPLTATWKQHLSEYYAPKNFNFWYFFGSLALVVLVIQIVSGIFLTMHYKPDADQAFASVEYIMRDVPWGWAIRYVHATGASMFFVVVYLHMFRGLLYGSYRKPRELLWIFGMLIYLCLMAEAFFGYLLPWGQMSYWGAQVIVNLFGAVPFIGPDLAVWIRGDYVVSDEDKTYLSGGKYQSVGKKYCIKSLSDDRDGLCDFTAITNADMKGERIWWSVHGIKSLWRKEYRSDKTPSQCYYDFRSTCIETTLGESKSQKANNCSVIQTDNNKIPIYCVSRSHTGTI